MTKLTHNQHALLSAVMGVSNCGQDQLFNGKHATYTAERLKQWYGSRPRPLDAEEIAWDFCGAFCENEEMADPFINEVIHWKSQLRGMSAEKFKSHWPRYAHLVEVVS